MSSKYDDYDWDELPADVKAAAELLGYSKKLWDNDMTPAKCDQEWDELTPEEQKAAAVLGYDQDKWEEDDSSSSEEE